MTGDHPSGKKGRGAEQQQQEQEQELRTRLIQYHTSFSSQATPLLCCYLGPPFGAGDRRASYLIQYQTPYEKTSEDGNQLGHNIGGSNGGGSDCASGDIWNQGSQQLEEPAWDDADGCAGLWPDDPDSGHPFIRAALLGDLNAVKDFVSRQTFDPGSKQAKHALLLACRTGRVEMVQMLLDAGLDVHCKDARSGWQPIHIAAYCDHANVVEALVERGEWRRGVALLRFRGVTCSLLHLAAHQGCLSVLSYLLAHTARLGLQVDVRDAWHWSALHYTSLEGRKEAALMLLQAGADINIMDPNGVTPLHIAVYKEDIQLARLLLAKGANPKVAVRSRNSNTERGIERSDPVIKFHLGSTLLHWAAGKGYDDLVADLLARGLVVDATDSQHRTPMGVAMWAGHTSIVNTLLHEKVQLSEEDKDWHRIGREEVGLCIIRVIEETAVCPLDACRTDGFTLLHLSAQLGYPNMLHRILSLKVSPDVRNNQGETPLFMAIRSNQLACVQQLLNAGTRLSIVDNRGGTALHMAAKNGNVTVIDMLLTTSEHEEKELDINKCDNIGYTPVYYAINASRYDIVQRFLEYSLVRKIHVKATNNETLLQFYTERNNLGQFDNAVVRVLECEKCLHGLKANAEMCLRVQLGTTESSSKARLQLQAMYESTRAQRHCWNFWFFLSCFLLPSVFYYLDVYTDILLAVEYYRDFMDNNTNSVGECIKLDEFNLTEVVEEETTVKPLPPKEPPMVNVSGQVNRTWWRASPYSLGHPYHRYNDSAWISEEATKRRFLDIFHNITETQEKINFVLTLFFILLPIVILSMWNLYIHVTQPDILPIFRRVPAFLRVSLYTLIFLTPLAPVMAYLENTYAQMKHMNVTARQMQEVDSKSYQSFCSHGNTKTYRHHMRDMKIRKYYDLKHVAQMRVAITNVMEATLESAFQLILQLYIVGTRYYELDQLTEVTLGSILSLSPSGPQTQLSKQVFSVLISLVSLTWSFTSYHRFSKLGGLTILNALPLLFAIFFQVVSRAIACTIFTLAYTWKIFVVLGIHFVLILIFKLKLEERSVLPHRKYRCCNCILTYLRPYFYVFLGTIASTLVYFRLERPSAVKKQLSRRHSTVVLQVLFLVLALLENFVLLSTGIIGLDKHCYGPIFIITSVVLCTMSLFIGVILHGVYYGCFGHPWVNINGPTLTHNPEESTWILAYYREGRVSKWTIHSCCTVDHDTELPTDNVYRPQDLQLNGKERQVKDLGGRPHKTAFNGTKLHLRTEASTNGRKYTRR
ncbi:uncharacterized protein LOC143027554 isoform X2 [Oratosquilla oratoria]|uniref:uncharacterized protein LOC143027554 isoform X2 n=1 Tax=Oratosquilla oratoria TaxID=337810 RepID=UPI003F76D51F